MSLGQEAVTIAGLERSYLTDSRRKTIIALEELNFVWCDDEATEVADMWRMGIPIDLIADNFARDPDEVAILLMHLARRGRIKARPGGVFGGKV